MQTTLELPALLRLIDDRSAAFRAAVESAPDLGAKVPTCPEWTLLDLARHLGGVHRFWAAVVDAGPAEAPPTVSEPALIESAPVKREALLAWSAESTRQLSDALRAAGPDRGCWTWWGGSQSPQTAGAVARHQVQEATVHAYDAQITVGAPEPLPTEAALDGVDEFTSTCCAGPYSWPYGAAVVDYHATEGSSWRLWLTDSGIRSARIPAPGSAAAAVGEAEGLEPARARVRGTAAELVLMLYGRIPIGSLHVEGDQRLLELLRDWNPDE